MQVKSALIVDDDSLNLRLTQMALQKHGYEVRTARRGHEALGMCESFWPRIVLTDIQLPDIDGLELARRLKASPAGNDLVVIAQTAFAMNGDRERALDAGCAGFLTKPIFTRTLPALIDSFLAAPAAPSERVPPLLMNNRLENMNLDSFRDRAGGDEGLMCELIEIFFAESPRQLEDIRQAVSNQNASELFSAAHALKGAIANFSAELCVNAAARLEEMGRTGDLSGAAECCGDLANKLIRLHSDLLKISEGGRR